MTLVSVYQLQFMPRIHHLKRLFDSDVFVAMDDHDFGPHWQRRTLIKGQHGLMYLPIPLDGGQGDHIRDIRVKNDLPWREQMMERIRHAYSRAPYYREIVPDVEAVLGDSNWLYGLLLGCYDWLFGLLAPKTRMIEQYELGAFRSRREQLMAEITKAVGGEAFHCSQEYMQKRDATPFREVGVELKPQDWRQPEYPQQWGDFAPGLSVLDALFNVGIDGTRKILEVSVGSTS